MDTKWGAHKSEVGKNSSMAQNRRVCGYQIEQPVGSHELLGLEEALEVPHLPRAHHDEDAGLRKGPPQHPLVRALACRPEPLLAVLKGK